MNLKLDRNKEPGVSWAFFIALAQSLHSNISLFLANFAAYYN